ncbi:ABC transporter ATP-binding protein [Allohahella marinimesophila]|uniref:Dipeptide ABC transporter ATP-binding protein n=1 Tax=Allohahella marinimesophila TaxID=1054972 RepID=A0ABP7NSD3_9GAMM
MKRAISKRHLLSVRNISKRFVTSTGLIRRKIIAATQAVDNVSFDLHVGETVGLVGGSGSGKSTLARIILRLIEADSGEVWFDGEPITSLAPDRMRLFRKDFQVVFQDPLHSLNPRRTVAENIMRPLLNFGTARAAARLRAESLMVTVGLNPATIDRYPHEFSGGQCQRIAIARALALKPRLLILDEPVSALDVSVQAQILNLLKSLQAEFNMTYLFVSHDLGLVRWMCDRTLVMYRGKLLETGNSDVVHDQPAHPFTRDFIATVLTMSGDAKWADVAARLDDAETPAEVDEHGCIYAPVCSECRPVCRRKPPVLRHLPTGQAVACHLYEHTSENSAWIHQRAAGVVS